MIIKINKIFLYNSNLKNEIELEITGNKTINDIINHLSINNTDYAMFFINDKLARKDDLVCNDDTLLILPIFDGG
ncbi:MoaD/ThiS family protein [Sedimentibacter sp.]|uniref:MoaD/ThiS family protein n=1 Tax=Sedimentibacter sp. TaxID=1960295 RepID=UPI0028AD06E5|nr:MoaD/ThiS family protein [Sedimentibacter sp.]